MATDGKWLSDHEHSYPKSRDAIASKNDVLPFWVKTEIIP